MRWLIYIVIAFIVVFALVGIINQSDIEEEVIYNFSGFDAVEFVDVTQNVGIDYVQSTRKYKIDGQAYLRGDLQGLFSGGADDLDLYVTRLDGNDILYRNDEGSFVDVTDDVGLNLMINSNKARWVDVDSDGFEDLFVSVVGEKRNYLFMNYDGKFVEEGFIRGLSESEDLLYGFGIAIGDYDGDGWQDIMTSNWDRMTIRKMNMEGCIII